MDSFRGKVTKPIVSFKLLFIRFDVYNKIIQKNEIPNTAYVLHKLQISESNLYDRSTIQRNKSPIKIDILREGKQNKSRFVINGKNKSWFIILLKNT